MLRLKLQISAWRLIVLRMGLKLCVEFVNGTKWATLHTYTYTKHSGNVIFNESNRNWFCYLINTDAWPDLHRAAIPNIPLTIIKSNEINGLRFDQIEILIGWPAQVQLCEYTSISNAMLRTTDDGPVTCRKSKSKERGKKPNRWRKEAESNRRKTQHINECICRANTHYWNYRCGFHISTTLLSFTNPLILEIGRGRGRARARERDGRNNEQTNERNQIKFAASQCIVDTWKIH